MAELIGEEGGERGGDPLAGADPDLRVAVEQVLCQFAFQLDPFQVQAVAKLLAGKSGRGWDGRQGRWQDAQGCAAGQTNRAVAARRL